MAHYNDTVVLHQALSLGGLATSAIGAATEPGNFGYSITNYARDHTLSATEGTAANIAAVLATLIVELKQKGIVNATFS